MKQLFISCDQVLSQLEQIVEQLLPSDFSKPCLTLGGATIGQHIRHCLDLFLCLQKGVADGTVSYDKRLRDKRMETDKSVAFATVHQIREYLRHNRQDFHIKLEMCLDREGSEILAIDTTYFRELAYNIEHVVHHLAILKIGIKEIASYVAISGEVGVAVATIRARQSASSRAAS